jgi:plastocyanin
MTRTGILLLAVLALAAAAPARAEDNFVLSIKDHRFEPTELEVPAGTKITLIVKNLDPTPEEFESIDMRREKVVVGGQEITVYIGPLRPGRYEFFGDFHPDTARGHIVAK